MTRIFGSDIQFSQQKYNDPQSIKRVLPASECPRRIGLGLIHYSAFFGSEDHIALDRNPRPGYDTLLLRMIPGDLLSAFPHRQVHNLPGLLDS